MCAKKASSKKPTKPKAKKPCKSELLEEADELLKRIEKAESECQKARTDADIRKEAYRTARAFFGERVEKLRTLCRARKEKHPLFEAAEQPADVAATPEVKPIDKDAWRSLPLANLELPAKVEQSILDFGLSTLGALSDHVADQGLWWAKEIKGLGEKGNDAVCDSFVVFWNTHPEYEKLAG
jgi:hypothetical protein